MASEWDKQRADALKILGDKGNVPDIPDAAKKANTTWDKAYAEFSKSRDACEEKLLAMENANDAMRNAVKQFEAKIDKADFNLDSKDKDQVKKIQQARDLLTGFLDDRIAALERNDKALDELDKHLIQLSKYKPPDS
jgi:predicted  nucleic acid-binding Zn-ribbon protein